MTRRSAWECAVASGCHKRVLCVMIVCLAVLMAGVPPARAGGLASGGEKPTPPGDPGDDPGKSTGDDGAMMLLDFDGPSEPFIGEPPNPPDVSALNATVEGFSHAERNQTSIPPLPDFTVSGMRSSHEMPQQSTNVNVSVIVQNVGVAPTVSTDVALYCDSVDPEHLVGIQTVSMVGRNDTAYFLWFASAAGNYTLIAYVDPSNETEESDEENNQDEFEIETGTGPSWGLPDVTGYATFPTMPREDNETSIEVNVTNGGYGPAAGISVEAWERPTNVFIGQYAITSLAMGASDLRQLNWTPSTNGTLYVEVMTDPGGTLGEWLEDNNDQTWGVFVAPQGGCEMWIGDYHVPRGQTWRITNRCIYILGNVIVDGYLVITGSQVIVVSPLPGMLGFQVNPGGRLDSMSSLLCSLHESDPMSFKALTGSALYIGIYSKVYWPYTSQPEFPDSPGGVEVYTSSVAVTDSFIVGGNGQGAYFSSQATMNDVRNVTFRGNRKSGAVIAGASGVFRDNTFTENDFGLVVKGPADLAIRNSEMSDNARTGTKKNGIGLLVRDSSPDVEAGTRILRNDVGVWVNGSSSPTFTDCELEGNLHWGLYLGSPPESGIVSSLITESRIDASEEGVFSEKASITLEWVTMENFTRHGVFAANSSVQLAHNTLYPAHVSANNGLPGAIVCAGCSEPGITWNDIISRDPGANGEFWFGIQLVDPQDDVILANNTIKYGVYLVDVANVGGNVTDNALFDNVREVAHGAGILVNTNKPLRVSNNTFTNVSQGIYFYKESSKLLGTVRVDNNTMTYKVYPPGYWFDERIYLDERGNVTGQESETDQGHILIYDGSSPLVENNTLTGHVYGITVEAGLRGGVHLPSNPIVRHNRVLYSGARGVSDSTRGTLSAVSSPQVFHNWINHSSGSAVYTLSYADANYSSNFVFQTHGVTSYCLIINWSGAKCQGESVTYHNESLGTVFVSGNSTTMLWNNTIDTGDLSGVAVYDIAAPAVLANDIWRHQEGVTVNRLSLPTIADNNISMNAKGIAIYGPRAVSSPFTLSTPNRIRENYVGVFIHGATHNVSQGEYTVTLDGIDDIGANNYSVCANESTRPRIHDVTIDNSSLPTGTGVGIYSKMSGTRIDGGTRLVDNDYGVVVLGYNIYSPTQTDIVQIEQATVEGGSYGVYGGNPNLMIDTNFRLFTSILTGSSVAGVVAASDHWIEGNAISSPETAVAVKFHDGNVWDNDMSDSGSCVYASSQGTPNVRFNHFWNCTTAVYASGSGVPLMGESALSRGLNWIDNPAVRLDQRYGVYANSVNSLIDLRVVGNSFNYTNYSVALSHQASKALVSYNDFRGVTWVDQGCAINVDSSAGDIDISQNVLSNVTRGICSTGSSDVEISRNTVFTPGSRTQARFAIVASSTVRITNNTLLDVGFYTPVSSEGIRLDSAFVYNNTISRYYYGVRATGGPYSPIVRENTFVDDSIAVRCYNIRGYVEGNDMSQGPYGVTVEGGQGPYIANNTIHDLTRGTRRGIEVSAGNPHIVNNSISGAKWGIFVSGGAPRIHGRNRVENNTVAGGGYGLFVANSTSVITFEVYDNNTFKNNSVAGIYLGRNSMVTVRDNNTIADNGKYGIWIEEDAVIFDKQVWWNDVRDNGVQGLHIDADPGGGNYFHAECNWWKDADGPYDPTRPEEGGPPDYNNNTAGEPVSDYFWYRNETAPNRWWLQQNSLAATSCAPP